MRQPLAQCLKAVMIERGAVRVWAGDPNLYCVDLPGADLIEGNGYAEF